MSPAVPKTDDAGGVALQVRYEGSITNAPVTTKPMSGTSLATESSAARRAPVRSPRTLSAVATASATVITAIRVSEPDVPARATTDDAKNPATSPVAMTADS